MPLAVEAIVPEEIEASVGHNEDEYDVAEVEDDQVHPVGGDRAAVRVVKDLARGKGA